MDKLQFNSQEEVCPSVPYKRANYHRIFANRNVHMDKIAFIGFDMDYTLAEYTSPVYELLIYKHALSELVSMGYPKGIANVPYDYMFATRGVVFDKKYGNFLKIDPYGNILTAVHGLQHLELTACRVFYPSRFIDIADSSRYSIFNTLFEFPSMFLISVTIDYFDNNPKWKKNENTTCIRKGSICLSYKVIFDDVMTVFNRVHRQKGMKQETLDNISKYVRKDNRLPVLLNRIQKSGRGCFLVTNSDYWYTNSVMTYLLSDCHLIDPNFSEDWRSYFDVIVVDAKKPLFFGEGTSMCQVDIKTGRKHIGVFQGTISKGGVFTGGNSELLSNILGANGKNILYVGDHIFGDILKSKKKQGWRTYLVVPELQFEIHMWIGQKEKYKNIESLEAAMSYTCKNLDSTSLTKPTQINEFTTKIEDMVINMEKDYGKLGSLLRCGQRQTFFSGQLVRFADLYSHTCLNLIYYPFCYLFRSPSSLMPHEATVNVNEHIPNDASNSSAGQSKVTHTIPRNLTICAEEQAIGEEQ